MLRICYCEEGDQDFIRWTGNLLRGFVAAGRIAVVRQKDKPDLMLTSIWRRHRFPRALPVVLVTNENWQVFPPHFALRRYKAVIGVCPPPKYYWGDGPSEPLPFIPYPYEAAHFDEPLAQLFALRERRLQIPKSGFCCFVVSNTRGDLAQRRLEVFEQINVWRKVDSAGAIHNNTGYRAPRGAAFLDWIARYQFMICLENSKAPGYITEKALQAWLAGAVPIYDGGGIEAFNQNAFVGTSGPDYLAELQRLVGDPHAYQQRQSQELYRTRPSLRAFENRFAEILLSQ